MPVKISISDSAAELWTADLYVDGIRAQSWSLSGKSSATLTWNWDQTRQPGTSLKVKVVDTFSRKSYASYETRTLTQPLGAGWNLISMPYTPADDTVAAVFSSIAGQYDLMEAYDGCQPADPWRIYDPAAPAFVNTLTQINTSQGLWVHTTAAPTLALTGKPLTADVTLSLCAGWNLIGYPSASARDVTTVLASISGKFDLVEGYDGATPDNPWLIYDPAAPAFVNTLTQFQPGEGYWIHMTQVASLTIPR